ncbi:MAG: hypothetical protein ACXW20_20035, partial [Burkholderiales bacterium]
NSFYGIWDKNDRPNNIAQQTTVTSRLQLLQQTISDLVLSGKTYRIVSQNAASWSQDTSPPDASDSPSRHVGWYMDFPSATSTGERSVSKPILQHSRLIFTTALPAGGACSFGGTSFMMIVDPTTGGRIDGAVLDVDGNGLLNDADRINSGSTTVYASGIQSTVGISPTPTIVTGGQITGANAPSGSQIYGTSGSLREGAGLMKAYAIGGDSGGGRRVDVIGLSSSSGRVSWREVTSR